MGGEIIIHSYSSGENNYLNSTKGILSMYKESFNELGKAFIQVSIIFSEIGYKLYYTEYMAKNQRHILAM